MQILNNGAKLTPFLLSKPAQIGVLIVPGGGYGHLATGHEGQEIGAYLNARGYDAWMLEYTIAGEKNRPPIHPAPHNEALEAVRLVRARNRVQKLGVWGFSAGGHLAATLATQPEARLDFAVLAYPVISMESGATHGGSRLNLLGEQATDEQARQWSAQNRVSRQTPPTFIFHTADDGAVPVQNALLFAHALAHNGVAFEMHVHERGAHGVGLASAHPELQNWPHALEAWLGRR